MDANDFRNFAIDFIESGGSRDELLDYFGIEESTYYSWRSRGPPTSRIEQIRSFFEDDGAIEWGEDYDLSNYLIPVINSDGEFLNVGPDNLPDIYTPRGHLWIQCVGHIRVYGGIDDGKEFDEIYSRTTGNNFNYPSEAVPRLSEIIGGIFTPRGRETGTSGKLICQYISTMDLGQYRDADGEPFSAEGFLIWNTKYTDINPNKGRE
tara:strand:- start:498 stop:1118 length:621 start_codon:yes stop_codon:yes gene_type:complete